MTSVSLFSRPPNHALTRAPDQPPSSRVGLLINAMTTENYDLLKTATEDMLHQPQRGEKVHRHLFPLVEAAMAAGALEWNIESCEWCVFCRQFGVG